jgi:hypothetical protein
MVDSTPLRAFPKKKVSPRPPALESLENIFKAQASPATYAVYEDIISVLVRRGSREPGIRFKFQPALRDFLVQNTNYVQTHNKFARSYNKAFDGKHERFLLPVYPELELKKTSVESTEKGKEETQMNEAKNGGSMQIAQKDDKMSAPALENLGPSPNVLVFRQVNGASIVAANKPTVNTQLHSPAPFGKSTTAPAQKQPRNRTVRPALLAKDIPTPPNDDSDSEDKMGEVASEHTHQGHIAAPQAASTPARVHSTPAPAPAPAKTEPIAALTARCFLAWLRSRGKRFPTVPPNTSECAGLGLKLGVPKWRVYDVVLRHYLLETDSRRGQWHKEHRMQFLGEDPVFDE